MTLVVRARSDRSQEPQAPSMHRGMTTWTWLVLCCLPKHIIKELLGPEPVLMKEAIDIINGSFTHYATVTVPGYGCLVVVKILTA